jgi:hypothetical protein
VLVAQILTISFALVARRNHPDTALGLTILFSFLLCAIPGAWIRSDAKHARGSRARSRLSEFCGNTLRSTVWFQQDCPRRWLVVLHIEFEGGIAAPATDQARAGQTGRGTGRVHR